MSDYPKVQGYCPMGCGATLFLGEGGHITCSWLECPRPHAADELLAALVAVAADDPETRRGVGRIVEKRERPPMVVDDS